MTDPTASVDKILQALTERAKELSCIYTIEEILRDQDRLLEETFAEVVLAIPAGWQFPGQCLAKLSFRGQVFASPGYRETPWVQSAAIILQGERVGTVSVCYTQLLPQADEGPFLKEERKLIDTIAERLSQAILHRELRSAFMKFKQLGEAPYGAADQEWRMILDLLKRTDLNLFKRVSRKMLNHLSCSGIQQARKLLLQLTSTRGDDGSEEDENRPRQKTAASQLGAITEETFRIAGERMKAHEILNLIQVWIKEDRVNFLVQALEAADTSLVEIANAMERYYHTGLKATELSKATQAGLKTSLVRRLLTDHLDFVETSRRYLEIEDFFEILHHVILLPKSHGKLGGKSSGLFLAGQIIRRSGEEGGGLGHVRIPKTWYLPSDALLLFLAYNNLDDVYNWKYLEMDQIRQEYPHILQVFKSCRFPPEIVQGLATALDDFDDRPLIVRSSSLLEDRIGSAFSGKYKSLFLANQGDKSSRLTALQDAVAEVYASIFSPDPIEYRAARGLLDQHEEMAIMIQEVVGVRAGRYFLPAFSGVGFSANEFRWSPRIRREDGLLRLVPGLGTRAVDRLTDDYPVLLAPGQPSLRVNATPEEAVRYSPKKIDVIDLEANAFRTLEIRRLLEEVGEEYPAFDRLMSVYEDDRLREAAGLDMDTTRGHVVVSFQGLVSRSAFMPQMNSLLNLLQKTMRTPVDIEFAVDDKDFYLLQCRPQSYSRENTPSPIPRDIPDSRVLFSANRYVANGRVSNISHIVYVDPDGYGSISDPGVLREVGSAVGGLNKILPKRRFILMGPGRWGSRGDIKLGVSVTYADISNTAVLIEIARKRGNYVPELSFGTHFFQDLVESAIRYLPLYPDEPGVIFREEFFRGSPNMLVDLLPRYAHLAGTLRVIDVAKATDGLVLRILMNAESDEAVGIISHPGTPEEPALMPLEPPGRPAEDHSRWRLRMAQKIASEIDKERFGVKGLYLMGSTKNADAGPDADIDLLVHISGDSEKKGALDLWLEGWSRCLMEFNFLRTGTSVDPMLDVRYITDEDLTQQTSYARKIGAVTDAARPLRMR